MRTSGVTIETARLRLRSLHDDDLAELVDLIGNWEVARWISNVPHPYSEADGRDWIALVQQDHANGRPRRFAIALKETNHIIGGVGLDGSTGDESDEPSLGYWLGQSYWRNGYGVKRSPLSSITVSEPSPSRQSAHTPTRAMRRRKKFYCIVASPTSAKSN
jgi:RimJ/RimL family protein N-acetyltransferase